MKETMLVKKLVISVSLLIASFLILLTATIAWFTILPSIIDPIQTPVIDPNFTSSLFVGIDEDFDNIIDQVEGVDQYLPIGFENYTINNWIPGQLKYFKMTIENEGNAPLSISVIFENITDGNSSPSLLAEVLLLNFVHPSIPSRNIDDVSITNLIDGDFVVGGFLLATDVIVPFEGSITLYFTIKMSEDAGNIYQNLTMKINRIRVVGI